MKLGLRGSPGWLHGPRGADILNGTRSSCGVWLILAACTLLPSFRIAAGQPIAARDANDVAEIYHGFSTPPDDARPMVRWWWFGVAVERPEILHELQQMKADGIGGVELAFVYPQELNDRARDVENLPFLSPAMLQ